MIKVDRCILCGGQDLAFAPATVAPFVVERCGIPTPVPVIRSAWCGSCDFTFFDHRLEPGEIMKLYDAYRGEAYNQQRLRHEPYYHLARERYDNHDNDYHGERIRNLRSLFAAAAAPPERILDYGGERDGWLGKGAFPDSQVEVYDLSFSTALPSPGSQDLVLCCGVFEHASFPMELLRELEGYLKPGGLLYLEVPLDYSGGLAENLQKGGGILHEHLCDFSPRAMWRMLNRGGFQPLRTGQTYPGTLGVVARRAAFKAWPRLLEALRPASLPPRTRGQPVLPEADPMISEPVVRGLNHHVERWLAEGTTLAVVPAGKFTRGLLVHSRLNEANVIALCDQSPALHGTSVHGRPVFAYAELDRLAPDLILVASPMWEKELCASLADHVDRGRRVQPLSSLVWS